MEHPVFQLFSLDYNKLHRLNWCSGRQIPFIVISSCILSKLHLPPLEFSPLQSFSPFPPWYPTDNLLKLTYDEENKDKEQIDKDVEKLKFIDFC